MDKKAIIQELRAWNDAVLTAQALPFLEPLGLTMRFDADVFDEEVQDLINEVDYGFTAPEGCGITIIDTEICGLNG